MARDHLGGAADQRDWRPEFTPDPEIVPICTKTLPFDVSVSFVRAQNQ